MLVISRLLLEVVVRISRIVPVVKLGLRWMRFASTRWCVRHWPHMKDAAGEPASVEDFDRDAGLGFGRELDKAESATPPGRRIELNVDRDRRPDVPEVASELLLAGLKAEIADEEPLSRHGSAPC